MVQQESVLISVMHVPFFLDKAKSLITEFGEKGSTILMEESAFDNDKQVREHLQENDFASEDLEFLMRKVKHGTFFPALKEHAESLGLNVVSADGGIGREQTRKYFVALCHAHLAGKNGEPDKARKIVRKAKSEYLHNEILTLKERTDATIERARQLKPRIAVVGYAHGREIEKEHIFSKNVFVGNPIARHYQLASNFLRLRFAKTKERLRLMGITRR